MAQTKLLIGAHLSISGGLNKAIQRGQALDCTAIQIFTHSNRQWHFSPLAPEEIASFKADAMRSSIVSYVVHASYLINAASPVNATRRQSVKALIHELQRCAQLGINTLVLHPGSATDGDKKSAIVRLAESLDEASETVPGVDIALENMAGQGNVLGSTLEELAQIKQHCSAKKHIAFCLDTCHAFATGYQFDSTVHYQAFMQQFDDTLGIAHLKAIHINDSAKIAGARVDRHAHIGAGHIPLEAFWHIMHDNRLQNIPKILETPKDTEESDRKNLDILINLYQKKTPE